MRSCLLKEGENAGLAMSGIVLIIIVCPLSSLKIQYYTTITGNNIVGAIVRGAKCCKISGCFKNMQYLFFFFLMKT